MSDYEVNIGGDYTVDDGLEIDMGALAPGQAWWEMRLPDCPDCGGDLVWWEAGYVPGTRKCLGKPDLDGGCGSLFSVQPGGGRAYMRRERFYR